MQGQKGQFGEWCCGKKFLKTVICLVKSRLSYLKDIYWTRAGLRTHRSPFSLRFCFLLFASFSLPFSLSLTFLSPNSPSKNQLVWAEVVSVHDHWLFLVSRFLPSRLWLFIIFSFCDFMISRAVFHLPVEGHFATVGVPWRNLLFN